MRPADTRFQHAAAPNGHSLRLTQVVNPPSGGEPSDATQLNVDNAARAKGDSSTGLLFGMDAFVQTDRSLEHPLELDVAEEVVPAQRLLDHHEVVRLELAQERSVLDAVGGIRVHHEAQRGEPLAKHRYWSDVAARLDLNFDPLIARREFPLDYGRQFLVGAAEPDGNAGRNLF